MCKWHYITFKTKNEGHHCIPHIVPDFLLEALLKDMNSRGYEPSEVKNTKYLGLDVGGMCYTDRPMEETTIDGIKVEIPSDNVIDFIVYFKNKLYTEERIFENGQKYLKSHLWPGFAFVFTKDIGFRILWWLTSISNEAERKAEEFYKDKKGLQVELAEANQKVKEMYGNK